MNTPLKLKTLLGDYPNTLAVKRGELVPKLFEFEFADVKVPNRAFKRVVRNLEFDVAEPTCRPRPTASLWPCCRR